MARRLLVVLTTCFLALTASGADVLAGDMNATRLRSGALGLVERQVRQAFPDVDHITTSELSRLLEVAPDRLVLLDVRTPDELRVSRIAGAVPVSPEARSTESIANLTGSLEGKIVVAYCSIGLRSARLLVRIGQALRDRGAVELHNLEGGVFRWRNEGRPLAGADGPTRAIHTYNVLWRQFLIDEPDASDVGH